MFFILLVLFFLLSNAAFFEFFVMKMIIFRGDVSKTIQDILGGLRSACTYTGSIKLKELSKRATFIRVNQQLNDQYTGLEIPIQSPYINI